MIHFISVREKRIWFSALLVLAAIFSTLFIGRPLAELLSDQNVQAVFFVLGMGLVAATIILHAFRTRPARMEIAVILGLAAVYTMFFLRLGIPERSHLIEYSVLAILIHKGLNERAEGGVRIPVPALMALIVSFAIGVLDESIQIFLPERVFDPIDILFNGLAATAAIGSNVLIGWIRRIFRRE